MRRLTRSAAAGLIVALIAPAAASAQAAASPGASIPNSALHLLSSRHVDQTYHIQVALPDAYADATRSFPVVYVLDAERSFGMAADVARWLRFERALPDVIVVGIAYGEGVPGWWQKRSRDYTPSLDRSRVWGDWPLAGGAGAFADCLEQEVFPLVDGAYRTVPGDRTIVGLSFGGLFGAHVLFTRPQLFARYVLVGPALAWDHRRVFDEEAAFAASGAPLNAVVYTAVGSRDYDTVLPPWRDFVARVRSRDYAGLTLVDEIIPDEGHVPAFPAALVRGLRAVFVPRPHAHRPPEQEAALVRQAATAR
jgi:uncharacterized protein